MLVDNHCLLFMFYDKTLRVIQVKKRQNVE